MTEYTIYKISCNDDSITDFYIGSTNDFNRRKIEHKYDCKNDNKYLYKFIREHNGWDNWNMSILQVITCNKDDALKKEQYYIEQLKPTLNSLNAVGLDMNQWYQLNKQEHNEKNKQWYEQNKDKIKEQRKQYYEQNKDKIKEQRKQGRLKKKLEKQLKEMLSNNTSELTNGTTQLE